MSKESWRGSEFCGCFATLPFGSYNKRVSGFATLRLNPSLSLRTSDTRWPLSEMADLIVGGTEK